MLKLFLPSIALNFSIALAQSPTCETPTKDSKDGYVIDSISINVTTKQICILEKPSANKEKRRPVSICSNDTLNDISHADNFNKKMDEFVKDDTNKNLVDIFLTAHKTQKGTREFTVQQFEEFLNSPACLNVRTNHKKRKTEIEAKIKQLQADLEANEELLTQSCVKNAVKPPTAPPPAARQ